MEPKLVRRHVKKHLNAIRWIYPLDDVDILQWYIGNEASVTLFEVLLTGRGYLWCPQLKEGVSVTCLLRLACLR